MWEKVQGKNMLQPVVWNREWLVLDSTKLYFIKDTSTVTSSGTSGSGSGSGGNSNNHNTSSSKSSTEVQVICDLLLASVKESNQPTIITNNHSNNINNACNTNNTASSGSGMLDTKTYLYTFEVADANFKTYAFQVKIFSVQFSSVNECGAIYT